VKPFQFSGPASEELTAAIQWYESRRVGLGAEFYDAVVRAVERIEAFPEIGTPRSGRFPHRRLPIARFPYTIVYRVREHDIYGVAVAHEHLRPEYWKQRS
jgi:plasmid stabilization system protein ParE